MNQYSTEPEFTVETQLGKTLPITVPFETTTSKSWVQVQAELKLLSVELSMSVDILGKILDSVLVLEQSLGEQQ